MTITLPVVAPAGTFTVMLVELQLDAAPAEVPLKVTVFEPCDNPKFEPEIVTVVPAGPELGLRVEMFGAGAEELKITLFVPEWVLGVPSGVETLPVRDAGPVALAAMLSWTLNVLVPVRPAMELGLVHVMV